MKPIQFIVTLFSLVMASSHYVHAAGSSCSYSRNVQQKGVAFSINSRPASGCAVQIVSVDARKGNKRLAGFKADVDYLAQSAKAVDLNGDGVPELVVTSRTTGGAGGAEALDVYWLNGERVGRATVPELDGTGGYRGGDRFHFEDRLLVRTIPVYRDGDADGKPTGGTRSLKYDFKEGAFSLYVQTENAANMPENSSVLTAAAPAPVVPVKQAVSAPVKEIKTAAAPGRTVAEVVAGETGIEIRTNGEVAKFRTVRLDKPERIAIDIIGADSVLAGKKIHINRFGISTVRVGRNKGFLRVVFDTSLAKFPKFEVKSSSTGVLVGFPQ